MSTIRLPGAGPVPRLDPDEPTARPCVTPAGLVMPTGLREQVNALPLLLCDHCDQDVSAMALKLLTCPQCGHKVCYQCIAVDQRGVPLEKACDRCLQEAANGGEP